MLEKEPVHSPSHQLRRRSVIRASGAAALVLPALGATVAHAESGAFQHGVASGDPLPTG